MERAQGRVAQGRERKARNRASDGKEWQQDERFKVETPKNRFLDQTQDMNGMVNMQAKLKKTELHLIREIATVESYL